MNFAADAVAGYWPAGVLSTGPAMATCTKNRYETHGQACQAAKAVSRYLQPTRSQPTGVYICAESAGGSTSAPKPQVPLRRKVPGTPMKREPPWTSATWGDA